MRTPIYQVDAFASRPYTGNPAAVMPLVSFPDDAAMLAIAAENNLSETAFLVPEDGDYRLRWFTPGLEVPLCGHGTLATAAVVMERLEPNRKQVVFHTKSGALTVKRANGRYVMDFPARPSETVPAPELLLKGLGVEPLEVTLNVFNYLAILDSAERVRRLAPDLDAFQKMDRLGIIVSARGDAGYDFVSRYFAPQKGIPEDPVTGAAHCMLAPYWSKHLGKTEFRAYQASARGGEVICRLKGERVELEGSCVFFMEGYAEI
jgi:PhzF family phenazine biosynthesis protein